jgi:succinate dehydrogenase/fumarate reductase-like Fe-S protein
VQALIAYFIVVIAIMYAAWLFMPQAMRRWLIARLIAVVPLSQRARLSRLQSDTGSVGCSTCKGCAADEPAVSEPVRTIQVHRR